MVTYSLTHGVFEEAIIEITNIIHGKGGQVYMDGEHERPGRMTSWLNY